MIIHHVLQHSKTTDHPVLIDQLKDEHYDVVFAPMQQNQLLEVAEQLGSINTSLIVCVGNNLRAKEVEEKILHQNIDSKTVLFGFQATSGMRKENRVECLHTGKGSMSIGALGKEVDEDVKNRLDSLFKKSGYKLEWQSDMDSWLWSHMAFILPMVYVSYKEKCNLRTMSARQMDLVMEATREGFELLKMSGYSILPVGEEDYYIPNSFKRKFMTAFMMAIGKTKYGEYTITDHCRHAAFEMHEAEKAWYELRVKHIDYKMPAWDTLKRETGEWKELEELYGKNTLVQPESKSLSKTKIAAIVALIGVFAGLMAVMIKRIKKK